MKISNELQHRLICPVTKEKLNHQYDYLQSVEDSSIRYPFFDDIPILINNEKSLFSIKDFDNKIHTTWGILRI